MQKIDRLCLGSVKSTAFNLWCYSNRIRLTVPSNSDKPNAKVCAWAFLITIQSKYLLRQLNANERTALLGHNSIENLTFIETNSCKKVTHNSCQQKKELKRERHFMANEKWPAIKPDM